MKGIIGLFIFMAILCAGRAAGQLTPPDLPVDTMSAVSIDVVFACDLSSSMGWGTTEPPYDTIQGHSRLYWAQTAALHFLDSLKNGTDRASILGWTSDYARRQAGTFLALADTANPGVYVKRWFYLNSDITAARNFVRDSLYIDARPEGMVADGFGQPRDIPGYMTDTPRNASIIVSVNYLISHILTHPADSNRSRILIVLTDGNNQDAVATATVINAVQAAYNTYHIRTFMIGFNAPTSAQTNCTQIAAAGGGQAYFSNNPSTLDTIFNAIQQAAAGGSILGVEKHTMYAGFVLGQNQPNPFNPTTVISYAIPNTSTSYIEHRTSAGQNNTTYGVRRTMYVTLSVYNTRGHLVRTLVHASQGPGYYSAIWDGRADNGREMASGVYVYRITAGDKMLMKKALMMK